MSNDSSESDAEFHAQLVARRKAERAATLRSAREDAARRGKEPFSVEALARHYTPHYVSADLVLEALAEQEETYSVNYPHVMTLEDFGKVLEEGHRYDW